MFGILNKFLDSNEKQVNKLQPLVDEINALEKKYEKLSDDQLKSKTAEFKQRFEKGETLDDLLSEAFAAVREAGKRTLNLRHYDVQLTGGIVLHQGKIAEQKTGEGKTLTASLPLYLNSLAKKGVHLATVNDYLARVGLGWMGPIYTALGVTAGCIMQEKAFIYDQEYEDKTQTDWRLRHLRPVDKKEAYDSDITYGTNNEFGFDYLRDNMVWDLKEVAQKNHFFAIVDEADSILIDEARTPLIISAASGEATDKYYQFSKLVNELSADTDYVIDEKLKTANLTEHGITKVEKKLGVANLYEKDFGSIHHIQQALRARALYHKDKDYVVKDNEIIIVDEFTGRLMQGRRWSEGLHQAIEAKEGVSIQKESQTLATISFQNYFRLYEKLAGMSGTAATEAEEFHKIYNLDVVIVPTHRLMIRKDAEDRVYKNEEGKFMAVVQEIKMRHERGQPILTGTISIAKNELLSGLLEQEGIPHEVLNAKNHEREAAIIAQAGRKGAVTIATNMAGRGVDIILGGNPPVPQEQENIRVLGGLHVIGTERHESRRIDLQLRGRSGRQGDPGSSQFFVSMEDDLMRIFGSDRMKNLMDRLGVPDDMPIQNKMVSRSIESAQKKVEGHNFDIRKHLVEYDDVMNKHREVIYRKRLEVLMAPFEDIQEIVNGIVDQEIETVASFHLASDSSDAWDLQGLYDAMSALFQLPADQRWNVSQFTTNAEKRPKGISLRDAVTEHLIDAAHRELQNVATKIDDQTIHAQLMRNIILRTIDSLWIEHLDLMERLREGIGLRGYGQREPLVEYKREAFQLFTQLINSINQQIAVTIFKVGMLYVPEKNPMTTRTLIESAPAKTLSDDGASAITKNTSPQSSIPVPQKRMDLDLNHVGRNDPCPCGSGKKFKKCYLAGDPQCGLLRR